MCTRLALLVLNIIQYTCTCLTNIQQRPECLVINTVNSGSGPTCLMVTFRQMAWPARKRINSFFAKAKYQQNCPVVKRAKSVYSPLIKSCCLNHMTLLSHHQHCKRLKASRTRCISHSHPWGVREHWEASVWRPVVDRTMPICMTDSHRQVSACGNNYK